MDRKNQVLMTVLGVFALVIVTVGVSYAFFSYSRTSAPQNITTGSLSFGFTDTGSTVGLSDALPVTDETANKATVSTKNVLVYDFAVSYVVTGNTSVTYTLSMQDVSATAASAADKTAMNAGNVKCNLYSGTTQGTYGTPVWQTAALSTYAGVAEKNVTETLTGTQSTYYRFKMWLDVNTLGFTADDSGSGKLPTSGDNYTSDEQTATAAWADKVVSVKFNVTANSTDTQ